MKQQNKEFEYVNKKPLCCEYRADHLETVISLKKQFEDVDKRFGNFVEYKIVSYQRILYLITKEEYEKISN